MFLESIAYTCQSPRLLTLHLARIERTVKQFAQLLPSDFPGFSDFSSFSTKLSPALAYFSYIKERLTSYTPPSYILPNKRKGGESMSKLNTFYKGRFLYHPGKPGEETIDFIPYEIKSIATLQPIEVKANLDYSFKYSERSNLNALYEMRGKADDVLIIKNGLISDSSYANIVLFDGKEWATPSTPLLKGVERENLLINGVICERRIAYADLLHYQSFKLINALRHFNKVKEEPLTNILAVKTI